jgi:hypothetical protein
MALVLPGIPGVEITAGSHVCALLSGSQERAGVLRPFLREGLSRGDKCVVGIDQQDAVEIVSSLGPEVDGETCVESGQLEVLAERSPELEPVTQSIAELIAFWEARILGEQDTDRYPFTRLGLEPSWRDAQLDSSVDLWAFESALSALTADKSVGFLCMYDMEAADGGLVIQLMKSHRHLLLGGIVVDNPYVTPMADLCTNPLENAMSVEDY